MEGECSRIQSEQNQIKAYSKSEERLGLAEYYATVGMGIVGIAGKVEAAFLYLLGANVVLFATQQTLRYFQAKAKKEQDDARKRMNGGEEQEPPKP